MTDNPKARFGNQNSIGKANRRKGDVNLAPYSTGLDPATIAFIKQYRLDKGLKSQGEVIELAIKLLAKNNA
jgi:hypothetical protein